MSEIILTIIIPVYNSENFVARCVASLAKQGIRDEHFQVLLIDDGSTDNTLSAIQKMESQYSFVSAFHKKNGGTGDARNFGLDKIKGKYLYFLDIDDYLADNTLSQIINVMDDKELELCYFQSIKTTSLDLFESQTKDPIKVDITDGIEYIAENGFEFEVWRYIINTAFFRQTGLRYESEKLLEDAFFTACLVIAAKRVGKTNLDVHRYVDEPTSAMNKPDKKHGKRMLSDLEELTGQYDKLINECKSIEHPLRDKFLYRLQLKKEFFVYFGVIRAYKGNFDFKDVWGMLQRSKKYDAYPFKKDKLDNDPFADKMKFIANNKFRLYTFFNLIRPLHLFKQKFISRESSNTFNQT